MNVIEIGKPYSGPVPQQDGLHFEIGPDGDMQLLIQFHKPSPKEKKALSNGFDSYSLAVYEFIPEDGIIIACWVFKFAVPVLFMDAPFHAGLYTDDRIKKFLNTEQNLLQVIILDGHIIQSIRVVGLHEEAMQFFKDVIKDQLLFPISRSDYDAAVNNLYVNSSEEIYSGGVIYKLRSEK